MKKRLIACLFFSFLTLGAYSQRWKPFEEAIPVFSDKNDSVEYALLAAAQESLYTQYGNIVASGYDYRKDTLKRRQLQLISDSSGALRALMKPIDDRAIRHTMIYRSRYTKWDTLKPANRGKIIQLSFDGYSAHKLPKEIFECSNLEKLELMNCSFTKIRRLKKLTKLTQIEIYNNASSGPLRLARSRNIRQLKIRSNSPDKLPRSYKKYPSLWMLDLSQTSSVKFPDVYKNKKLTSLKLVGNEIRLIDLPDKKQSSIEMLDLTNNKITRVPKQLAQFTSLQSLSLSNNKIALIEDGFSNLPKLEILIFYGNNLSSIPAELFRLPAIRSLDLSYNHLQQLADAITNMTTLVDLYVTHNEIIRLPDSLGRLKNLHGLYVNGNHLTELPESIGKLKGLKELRINSNQFGHLPPAVLNLTQLSWLDVSRNELTTLPESIFLRTNLDLLSLYGNRWDDQMQQKMPAWIAALRAHKTSVTINPPEAED